MKLRRGRSTGAPTPIANAGDAGGPDPAIEALHRLRAALPELADLLLDLARKGGVTAIQTAFRLSLPSDALADLISTSTDSLLLRSLSGRATELDLRVLAGDGGMMRAAADYLARCGRSV